jgi:hypothetical protein
MFRWMVDNGAPIDQVTRNLLRTRAHAMAGPDGEILYQTLEDHLSLWTTKFEQDLTTTTEDDEPN